VGSIGLHDEKGQVSKSKLEHTQGQRKKAIGFGDDATLKVIRYYQTINYCCRIIKTAI
jgi:hypothetical protein